jgi:hypothetical protein
MLHLKACRYSRAHSRFTARSIVCALLLTLAAFGATIDKARAATDFCPAEVEDLRPAARSTVDNTYEYNLFAFSSRTVSGTIIAETNRGWFSWEQRSVALTPVTYTSISQELEYQTSFASSPDLTVAFPPSITVTKAWVLKAGFSDGAMGWQAAGNMSCDPPYFRTTDSETVVSKTPERTDPAPGSAPPMAIARPTTAPFDPVTCDRPVRVGRYG